jgi:hypothetical protein
MALPRNGVSFESTLANEFNPLKLLQVGFAPVLRRPIEATGVLGETPNVTVANVVRIGFTMTGRKGSGSSTL